MRVLSAMVLISCGAVLSGCTGKPVTTTTTAETNQVPGAAIQGRVHGGQQVIVGANVYLYAADATGYGKASDSLLNSPGYVTTDGNGDFSITGDYTCPTASTQVYLYAVGGNSGSGTNSAAGLLAGLGSCGALISSGSSTFVFINEVSTVATAYSIAGFATDATHVSSSGSTLALTGIANAFATIPSMETLGTGVALATTPSTFGTVPQSEINTLANVLAACINSSGSGSSACTTLLGDALSGGTTGTQPTDTATAAINIAHNPGANVAALYGLQTPSSPFQTDLSTQPDDFTIGIRFSNIKKAGFMQDPADIAVDVSGNIWITDQNSGVVELYASSHSGGNVWSSNSPIQGGGLGFNTPIAIAIDASGNVWTANLQCPCVSELNSSGTPISGSSGYDTSALSEPAGIAVDADGNIWTANFQSTGGALFEYNPTNGWVNTSGFSGGGLASPYALAFDVSGNLWVANSGGPPATLSEFSSSGTANSHSPFTGTAAGLLYGWGPDGNISIDASGNFWVGNVHLAEMNSSGGAISGSGGYTGGGLDYVYAAAIDGAGNVWTANSSNDSISEFSSSGTPISGSSGYMASSILNSPHFVAIDGSGNLWLTNGGSESVAEVVGAAAPVVTPIVANLTAPYGSHAVNLP